ncbi:hypothetical protein BFP70_08065 [Thioclava sp. SK-1]|uniref:DUF4177 domain-containing protein n=1 Tax=Thioclava sp. SK-1 TaxID=1889770 RepID=UPI000825C5A4|nr:DUF4177 domain-containing protein [Thioclava sp. SK-1]OCX66059.1 hypothetical protein BFP70_08065 [Thioclava sp. SK-1]
MQQYEYKVLSAPAKGEKSRGLKTGVERFAQTMADTLNRMATKGWEFQRAETLPAEERAGLTGKTTVYYNLLVFRRALAPSAHVDVMDGADLDDTAANDEVAPQTPPLSSAERRAMALSAAVAEGPSPKLGPASRSHSDQSPKDQEDYDE